MQFMFSHRFRGFVFGHVYLPRLDVRSSLSSPPRSKERIRGTLRNCSREKICVEISREEEREKNLTIRVCDNSVHFVCVELVDDNERPMPGVTRK